MILEGRVFTRLQRFAGLPADLQHDTKQFQTHMERHKHTLFEKNHSGLVKSVYSVRGKELIDAVVQWLQGRDATLAQPTKPIAADKKHGIAHMAAAAAPMSKTPSTAAPTAGAAAASGSTAGPTGGAAAPMSTTAHTASAAAAATLLVSTKVRERARQIAEALVLAGVLTPYKDDLKHLNASAPEYYVNDTELLIPIAQSVTDLETTSVWTVANGTVYAAFLKRWSGLLASLTHGKEAYVVVNDTNQTAYVFESDLAREPIAEFVGNRVNVQYDNSRFEYGVRVTSKGAAEKESELFDAGSAHAQNEFLNVWLNIGANYHEAFNKHIEDVGSIYELTDRGIGGSVIPFDRYKGKVLLIVNVASKCGLASTNYPELAELDRKYRDQGLEVLAFPCNQFANQEPGTHDEILKFVKQYDAHYTFFEKGDVNGMHARPVFTYLKAKLPGSFGSFVKWSFTKFLVDRDGRPYKRYSPKELPLSFESDIVKLLNTPSRFDAPHAVAAGTAGTAPASTSVFVGAPTAHKSTCQYCGATLEPKSTCQFCAGKMAHKPVNDYGAAPTGSMPSSDFDGKPHAHHDHRTSANDFDGQPHAHESMNESRDPSLAHKMMHKMGIEPKAQHHNTPANEYGSETSAHHRHHDTPTNEFAGGAPTSHKSSCQYCDAPTSQHESATNFGASPTAHRSANEPRGDSSSAPKATCQFCAEKMRHNKSASEYETAPTAHHTSRNEYGGAPVMP